MLLSDGYAAYAHYPQKSGLTHAQCSAHTRRLLFEAQGVEPQAPAQGLDLIGERYAVKGRLGELKLGADRKRADRLTHAKPIVERFFAWINDQFEAQGLLPSNPLIKALSYASERRCGLEVDLNDPRAPIDPNHLERALKAIALGRSNWLFARSLRASQRAAAVMSLIQSAKLNGHDPFRRDRRVADAR